MNNSDMVRFSDGHCYVGEGIKLEAPLEAFGQCKLVSAFGELTRPQVLFVAAALHLTLEVRVEVGPNQGKTFPVPYDEVRWTTTATLQKLWFEQIPGGIPRSVQQNYDDRYEHFQRTVSRIQQGEVMTTEAGAVTKKQPKSATPKATVITSYELTEKPLSERHAALMASGSEATTTNHVAIVLSILKGGRIAMTALCAACEATGRYVRKPGVKETLRANVKYILDNLEEQGVVHVHEETVHPPTPVVQGEMTEATVSPAPHAKPPAVQGTKSATKPDTKPTTKPAVKPPQAAAAPAKA